MVELAVPVTEDLATELEAVGDRLPEILELGWQQWQAREGTPSVQRLRQLLARHDLLAELEPAILDRQAGDLGPERLSPLKIEGRPVSEWIVEERNRW